MARSAMANVITRTRQLVGDATMPYVISDDQIQDLLDEHRSEFRYRPLLQLQTYSSAGAGPYYYTYTSGDWGDWEEDAVLSDGTYTTVSATTSDYHVGRWTFAAEPVRPIYITGHSYDIYASGERVLIAWANKLKLEFDFSSDDQRFARNQQVTTLLEMARQLGSRRRDHSVKLVRTDLACTPNPALGKVMGF